MALLLLFIVLALLERSSSNVFQRAWNTAIKQTLYEQEVEDINAVHKIDNHLARRLIVMPLTDAFKPNRADLMHDKIQYGDKCSLPTSIGRLIFEKRYEVPWLFEVKPVRSEEYLASNSQPNSNSIAVVGSKSSTGSNIEKVYIGPLDFRSPENYIFLPKWMMHDLNLKSNDIVDVSFVRIKLAELVVFQPLSLDWDELMEQNTDPKVLLEHEINKYASLTAGSTIYIECNGIEYPLYVKETFAEGGVSVKGQQQQFLSHSPLTSFYLYNQHKHLACPLGVRVQDSDIRTDIDRSVLDALIKKKEEEEEELDEED